MNDVAIILLDSNLEWWPIASGTLAALIGGLALGYFKRVRRREDDQDTKEKSELKTGIAGIGLQLATEIEKRESELARESRERRDKDDALGEDIQDIRGVVDHHFGTLGKDRPRWREKK